MLAVSLVTLGSPSQLTGGYLYHQRMADAAPSHGCEMGFVSFPERPFPLPALWGRRGLREAAGAGVILVDSIAAAFLAPVLRARRPATPIVAVVHQTFGGIDHGPLRARLQAPLDRSVYAGADRVIAASDALAEELAAGGVDRARLEVVAPGSDVAVPERPLPDLRLGRRVAFLAVGNWVERKGIVDLVEAFALLPPDAGTLHLAGREDVDPGYASRVRHRLRRPDVAGRVVVHGPLPRTGVATLMAAADAFVLPSVREPYGTVYGEALALGCPVVGWRAGNLPHLAEDGSEGLLVPTGDVPALAAALSRLAGDAALLARLRDGAQARGRSLPTWEQSARRFFAVVNEVAGGAR
jgi:glycosyltransferase involved in cell wall biosynthesis